MYKFDVVAQMIEECLDRLPIRVVPLVGNPLKIVFVEDKINRDSLHGSTLFVPASFPLGLETSFL